MEIIVNDIRETKFAYVISNRKVVRNKSLIDDIKKHGILQPITVIKGDELEDCPIYTVNDGNTKEIPNEEKKSYYVILDGQHRISSLKSILKENNIDDKIKKVPMLIRNKEEIGNINDYIIAINNTAKSWSNADYISNADKRKNDDNLIKTIGIFNNMGFSISTISRYICLGPKYITKDKLPQYVNGESSIKYADYERAIRLFIFLKGKGFSTSFLKKRYLIDIISEDKKQTNTMNNILNKINYLRRVSNINELKHSDIENNIIKIIDEDYDEAISKADNAQQIEEIKKSKDYLSLVTDEEIEKFLNTNNKQNPKPQEKKYIKYEQAGK